MIFLPSFISSNSLPQIHSSEILLLLLLPNKSVISHPCDLPLSTRPCFRIPLLNIPAPFAWKNTQQGASPCLRSGVPPVDSQMILCLPPPLTLLHLELSVFVLVALLHKQLLESRECAIHFSSFNTQHSTWHTITA